MKSQQMDLFTYFFVVFWGLVTYELSIAALNGVSVRPVNLILRSHLVAFVMAFMALLFRKWKMGSKNKRA